MAAKKKQKVLRSLNKEAHTVVKLLESAEATLLEASNRLNGLRYHYGAIEITRTLAPITDLIYKLKYEDDDD